MMDQFIKNFKLAGGEILDEIPKDWYECNALFGVAENGAVWVEEYNKELFLSENVVAIMPKKFVKNITEAMSLIENSGVFISGPSKTADIESFLVFGAHGPKRFGIFFKE
jgi:L-lactate dehydrogenase complex protein LldG